MVVAEAVSEFEKETNIKFDIADYSNLDFSGERRDDTESFLIDYLSSNGSTASALSRSEEVSLAEAKATSVAYAIECAQWSISQNRATDIVSEAEYMFISHYVDRKDYFWNQGDPSLLLDGEARSESDSVLAKWITNYDRQAYNTYMDSTKVSSAIQRVGNIALGVDSLLDMRIKSRTQANQARRQYGQKDGEAGRRKNGPEKRTGYRSNDQAS